MTDRPRMGQTSPGYGPLPGKSGAPSSSNSSPDRQGDAPVPGPQVAPDFGPVSPQGRAPEPPRGAHSERGYDRGDRPRVEPRVPVHAPEKFKAKGPPAVDIDLVYERRTAPLPDQAWVFLEIWTRNTIYQLDSALHCIDVVDQLTRRAVADHPLRGSRLVGGQSRDGDAMELSHPFPRPGSEAVFEQSAGKHVRFSQTSTVTRVVMRLRVLTVEPEQLLPTWEDMSGRWESRSGAEISQAASRRPGEDES